MGKGRNIERDCSRLAHSFSFQSTAMLILKYRIKINFKQKKNKEHSIHTDRFSIQNLLFKNVVRDSSERKEEKNEFSPLSIQIDAIASSPIYQNITRRGWT